MTVEIQLKMSKNNTQYIIIVGCGRLGSYLASRCSSEGNSVVVIDRNPDAFKLLTVEFSGFTVEGDATEYSVLEQAKIKSANWLLAVTRDDNVNLMVAQIAKRIHGVEGVIARVYDPHREEVYNDLDIQTLCPTTISGNLFLGLLGVEGI